ncbi:beta-N-acetylhexosaminidase [Lapidilactobacillus gannanensis]|uniref:Beta-N-acetylhexosaminidase n=1 Tax=Lapidilactobacillus gannanensis TaxID=2486002 RepID=A0ABW4BQF4_9LACO|nr:beta-N-acetylhexosaminidase [Lapidilactobacillus gannanensis]
MVKKIVEAGEAFIVGFHGTIADDHITEMIRNYHVGGVILFSRNISNPQQLANLTNQLQKIARDAGYQDPLLICLDQENGVIRRINQGTALLPGAMAIAATGKPTNATLCYRASANELKQMGINWNLAPDSDVNNNISNPVIGVRSFGDQPEVVAEYVKASVIGLQSEGVASCLKHFPGHGNTTTDSHHNLPIIQQTLAELRKIELLPFIAGIEANTSAIMVAHILFPYLDDKLPASLSAMVMTNLLRQDLKYPGLIVTDDLEMLAIAEHYGTAEACLLALQNGADMVMVSHVYEQQKRAINLVNQALATKQLASEKLSVAIDRNQKLRREVGEWQNHFVEDKFKQVVHQHQKLAENIYRQSLTVLKNTEVINDTEKVTVISFHQIQQTKAIDFTDKIDPLVKAVKASYQNCQVLEIPLDHNLNQIDLSSLNQTSYVIVGTTNINSQQDLQIQVLQKLTTITTHISVIVQRNPYDIQWLPQQIKNEIVTYESTSTTLKMAIEQLAQGNKFFGQLPIHLR